MNLIKKCVVCKAYTMKEIHCGERTKVAHPAKFSPVDKWARYRRIAKGIV